MHCHRRPPEGSHERPQHSGVLGVGHHPHSLVRHIAGRQRRLRFDRYPLDGETGEPPFEDLFAEARCHDPLRSQASDLCHQVSRGPRLDEQQGPPKIVGGERDNRLGTPSERQPDLVSALVERARDVEAERHRISGVESNLASAGPRRTVTDRRGRDGRLGRRGGTGGASRAGGCGRTGRLSGARRTGRRLGGGSTRLRWRGGLLGFCPLQQAQRARTAQQREGGARQHRAGPERPSVVPPGRRGVRHAGETIE